MLQATLLQFEHAQAARVLDDYQFGRDYIDPSHVKDGGVTKDHTRQWKVLQELQVCLPAHGPRAAVIPSKTG